MKPFSALLGLALALPAWSAAQPADVAAASRLAVARANALRAEHGLAPVAADPKLAKAAQGLVEFMARTERYDHEADGRRPAERAEAAGYDYCRVTENIAWQFHSRGFAAAPLAQRFVQGWRDSPEHRANMLDPDVTDTAVAIAQSARSGRYYAVQMFGRPSARSVEFRIANTAAATVSYELDGKSFRIAPRQTRTHRQCTPPRLSLQLPGESRARTLRPAGGERYTIRADGARLELTAS